MRSRVSRAGALFEIAGSSIAAEAAAGAEMLLQGAQPGAPQQARRTCPCFDCGAPATKFMRTRECAAVIRGVW